MHFSKNLEMNLLKNLQDNMYDVNPYYEIFKIAIDNLNSQQQEIKLIIREPKGIFLKNFFP